jgi:ribosome-associated protein
MAKTAPRKKKKATPSPAAKKRGKADVNMLCDVIIDSIQDKKGEEIVLLDLRSIPDTPADFFIICSAAATVQAKAIADHVGYRTKEELNDKPWHIEGYLGLEWVLMDYVNIVVHIFLKHKRDYYELEDLWSDAKTKKIK